jgi:multicomponent Na+:H+ antiporter subunit D
MIPAMSLGGIPPLSGFFAKFALVREGLALEQWTAVAFALAVGLLTLYSMIKIWNEAFWKNPPAGDHQPDRKVPWTMTAPCIALAACTITFGFFPGVFFNYAERAATQIVDPTEYIQAVFSTTSGKPTDAP